MAKNKKDFEIRSVICGVRAEPNESNGVTVYGAPIVYNSPADLGYFEEIIEAGALDDTDLTDVRFLINHNTDDIPLARSRRNNGNSTMQLMKIPEGLGIEAQLDTENNASARSLASAIARGDISGMSFMFTVLKDRWERLDTDYPLRYITSIGKVIEVSAVTFPAYATTSIGVRSEALESARLVLERARSFYNTKPTEDGNLQLLKEKIRIITGGI